MTKVRATREDVRVGDDVQWTFNIVDENGKQIYDSQGNLVDFSGANGSYRISDVLGGTHYLALTQGAGVVFGPQTATVSFNASSVQKNSAQYTGVAYDQFRVSLNGRAMVVSEGIFNIVPLIP